MEETSSGTYSGRFYLTSEQLLGPTGSFRQLDIAMTAASMDASSPCFIQIWNLIFLTESTIMETTLLKQI